jgi:hypothetical protein
MGRGVFGCLDDLQLDQRLQRLGRIGGTPEIVKDLVSEVFSAKHWRRGDIAIGCLLFSKIVSG